MPAHTIGAQSMLRGVAVNTRRKTRADTAGTVQPRSALKLPVREKPKATTTTKSGSNQWSLKRTIKEKSLGGIGTELSKDVRPGNFSRENEKFVGRMAMIGMAAAVIGEAQGNGGVLSQLSIETGISPVEAEDLILAQVAVVGALAATSLSNPWLLKSGYVPVGEGANWREKLGLEAEGPIFGFTETNELFIGRLAMVAFAGVIVVEAFTGNGVLGQLGVETGLPTGFEEEALFGGAAFFALSAAFPSVLALVNGSAKDE